MPKRRSEFAQIFQAIFEGTPTELEEGSPEQLAEKGPARLGGETANRQLPAARQREREEFDEIVTIGPPPEREALAELLKLIDTRHIIPADPEDVRTNAAIAAARAVMYERR